jgi:hypothetical protein
MYIDRYKDMFQLVPISHILHNSEMGLLNKSPNFIVQGLSLKSYSRSVRQEILRFNGTRSFNHRVHESMQLHLVHNLTT